MRRNNFSFTVNWILKYYEKNNLLLPSNIENSYILLKMSRNV